ncbi:MAG: hypothetical protein PHX46_02680 [Bacilli bacterium]|nr:hypothetical protein [Bacilli bacterium]
MYILNSKTILKKFHDSYYILNYKNCEYVQISRDLYSSLLNIANYKYDNENINKSFEYLYISHYLEKINKLQIVHYLDFKKDLYIHYDDNNYIKILNNIKESSFIFGNVYIFIKNNLNNHLYKLIIFLYYHSENIVIHVDYDSVDNCFNIIRKYNIQLIVYTSNADEILCISEKYDSKKILISPLPNENFKDMIYLCLTNKINFNFNTFALYTKLNVDIDKIFFDFLEFYDYFKIRKKSLDGYKSLKNYPNILINSGEFYNDNLIVDLKGDIVNDYSIFNKCYNCSLNNFCENFNVTNCEKYKKIFFHKLNNIDISIEELVKFSKEVYKNV